MITTIIFDLDGTLYPESEFVKSGFVAVSEYLSKKYKINYDKIFSILKKDFKNGLRGNNFNVLLEKLEINENIGQLVKVYKNHRPLITLFPDSINFIERNNKNLKLGLITNGDKKTQINKISALKIKNYFKAIFISTNFGDDDWQKSIESFKCLLRKLKSIPEETIYVGDNPLRDFMGARKLGIITIRVKRKNNDYNNIFSHADNKADYEVLNLSSLEKIIKNKKK